MPSSHGQGHLYLLCYLIRTSHVVDMEESPLSISKRYITAVLYNYYVWSGRYLSHLVAGNEGLELLSHMLY